MSGLDDARVALAHAEDDYADAFRRYGEALAKLVADLATETLHVGRLGVMTDAASRVVRFRDHVAAARAVVANCREATP